MYTINHMWVANFKLKDKIPEGRSKVYGLYKTIDDAIVALNEWFMQTSNNGCKIHKITETMYSFLSPDEETRGYIEIQKIEEL